MFVEYGVVVGDNDYDAAHAREQMQEKYWLHLYFSAA